MSVVRYPSTGRPPMDNGVAWVRWFGIGWWSQDKSVATENHKDVVWPMHPMIPLWNSRRRRVAVLLPYRES